MLNVSEDSQYQELGSDQVFEAVGQMQREDFSGMAESQAALIFNTIGLDQSLTLETPVFAGMVSSLDPAQFQQMDGGQVAQIVGALSKTDLAGLRNEQAFSVAGSLDAVQIGEIETGRLSGLTTALEANDIDNLGSDVVTVIAGNIEVADLTALDSGVAGSIIKQVADGAIRDFNPDRVKAALTALDANFFESGAAGFSEILGRTTAFDSISFEAPPALLNVLAGRNFENLFGG